MGKKKLPPPEDLNRIKAAMAEAKKSRAWLAEEIGVSEATVSSWYQNHSQPHLSDLKRIAVLIKVDICDLLVRTKGK